MNLVRLLELAGVPKAPTIVSASTEADGGINRKTADRILDPKSFFRNAKSPMAEDGWSRANDYENFAEAAESFAYDHFDPQHFMDSEVFQDMAYEGREDPISDVEIVSALEHYLRNFIHQHYEGGEQFDSDCDGLARSLYPQVQSAMKRHGHQ